MDLNSNAVGLDLWGQTAEKSIFLAILLYFERDLSYQKSGFASKWMQRAALGLICYDSHLYRVCSLGYKDLTSLCPNFHFWGQPGSNTSHILVLIHNDRQNVASQSESRCFLEIDNLFRFQNLRFFSIKTICLYVLSIVRRLLLFAV